MLDIAVLAGIGVSFASVLLVFGCVCQLFKKSPPGFSVRLFCPTLYHLSQFEIFDFKKFKIFKRKKKSNLYNCNTSSSIEFVPAPDLKLYILILFFKIKVLSHLHFSLALRQQKANLLPERSYLACSHLHNRYVKCKYTLNI